MLAPLLAPHDPLSMDVAQRLARPTLAHLLGQDEYGRDVLSRLIWGARVSLTVAILSALISGAAGVAIGLIGGYFGGIAELFTVRLTDVVLSFPPILLALLVVTQPAVRRAPGRLRPAHVRAAGVGPSAECCGRRRLQVRCSVAGRLPRCRQHRRMR